MIDSPSFSTPLAERIRQVLKVQNITILNGEDHQRGVARFLHGTGEEVKGSPSVFFKISRTPEHNQQLKAEASAMEIASRIGIFVPHIVTPYQELHEGIGILGIDYLNPSTWMTLRNREHVIQADPHLGTLAGEVMYASSGKEIPLDTDISLLNTNEWRSSPEMFWAGWNSVVCNAQSVTEESIGHDEAVTLTRYTDEVKSDIVSLLADSGNSKKKQYFFHGDATPYNMAFSTQENATLLLDLEYAGVTESKTLAQLTDLSNFFGRCWANTEMQFNSLKAFHHLFKQEVSDAKAYALLRTAVVLGSILFADGAADKESTGYLMGQSLLRNIDSRMMSVEKEFGPTQESQEKVIFS